MLLAQKSYCEGALALELYCARLVDEQHTGAARGRRRGAPAAGSADADRQELAQRVVPGSQLAGDPDPWRLRLHARFPGGAVLARQPPEHDPRGHARHPGGRPAGPQGADGRRPGLAAARRSHQRHDRTRDPAAANWPNTPTRWARRCSRSAPPPRRPGPRAIPARRWPMPCRTCRPSATWCWPGSGWTWLLAHRRPTQHATLPARGTARARRATSSLRIAEDRRLARRRRNARPHLRQHARGGVLMASAQDLGADRTP